MKSSAAYRDNNVFDFQIKAIMLVKNNKNQVIKSEGSFKVPFTMPCFSAGNTSIPKFKDGDLMNSIELSSN